MLPWKLGFIDHDAPPEAGGEKTVNGLTSPTCLTSLIFLTSLTCLTSWCSLSPVSPVSEAAECRRHRQNPSPELGLDRSQSQEEELPTDTK